MFLLGFILGISIFLILVVIYLIIENTILKKDLLDAIEELGVQQKPLESRKLIGFIAPKKEIKQTKTKRKS